MMDKRLCSGSNLLCVHEQALACVEACSLGFLNVPYKAPDADLIPNVKQGRHVVIKMLPCKTAV